MKLNWKGLIPHAAAIVVFVIVAQVFFSGINKEYGLRQNDMDHVMGMAKELMDYRLVNEEEGLWSNNMFGGMPGYQTNVMYPSNLLRQVDQLLKFYQNPAIGTLYMCMLGFYILMLCMRVNPWIGIAASVSFGLSTINILYLGGGHTSKVNAISYMAPALGGLILAFRKQILIGAAVFALFFGLHLASNHLQMTYYLAFLLGAVGLTEWIRLVITREWMSGVKATGLLLLAGLIGFLPNLGSILTTYEYSKLTTRGQSELTVLPPGRTEASQAKDGLKEDYILEYNMGKDEALLAMFIPNAKGGSSSEPLFTIKKPQSIQDQVKMNFTGYWGEQNSSAGAFYFGAIAFALFLMGLFFVRDVLRWPFLALSVLAIFLSMKDMHGLNDFFIHHFPMYNKFRDSKMILVLMQIMIPALGALFVSQMISNEKESAFDFKKLAIGAGVVVFLFLIPTLMLRSTGDFSGSRDQMIVQNLSEQVEKASGSTASLDLALGDAIEARQGLFKQDGMRAVGLAVVVMLLLLVYRRFRFSPYVLTLSLLAIMTVDMWSVGRRYMNSERQGSEFIHYQRNEERVFPYAADDADKFILNEEKKNAPRFNELSSKLEEAMKNSSLYGKFKKDKIHTAAEFGALNLCTDFRVLLMSGGVFSEASMPYFHKSLGGYHAAKLKRYQELIDFHILPEMSRLGQATNQRELDSLLASSPAINMLNTKYIKFDKQPQPLPNPAAMGQAWFVNKVNVVQSADSEMTAINGLNPKEEAIVHREFEALVSNTGTPDSSASIVQTEYATKKLSYQSKSNVDALAVFSEIYYPEGWVCRVDGKEIPTLRANYVLRAAVIPAGDHTIEWSFEPTSYLRAVGVNWAGSGLLFLFIGFAVFMSMRNPSEKKVVAN